VLLSDAEREGVRGDLEPSAAGEDLGGSAVIVLVTYMSVSTEAA